MNTTPLFKDTVLHKTGIEQAEYLQKRINLIPIHTVFVSPLKRTIQTCYHMFKHHPARDKIRFLLTPLIHEKLFVVSDIGASSLAELRKFIELNLGNQIKFDFELLNSLPHPDNWQLEVMDNNKTKQSLVEIIQKQ